jgi:16S rRNA (guanine527-N7)-methyltransferase
MSSFQERSIEHTLRTGLEQLVLPASETQVAGLLDYLALLQKWNKVYNLTAVRDQDQMLTHHLLDSLAVISPLRRQLLARQTGANGLTEVTASVKREQKLRLLDVGSGAGLPGIVIAICCPDITVHCVDAVAKKAAFISQVAANLKLPNLLGLHARVESLSEKYSVISSRALATLADFVSWSAPSLAEQGVWLAMKGKYPGDEIAALPENVAVFHVERLLVPRLEAERCIVWMRKT